MELRQGTSQIIRVGPLIAQRNRFNNSVEPISGAELNWFYWRYLIYPDKSVVDIVNYDWNDIPNCDGCYFLTLNAIDTSQLGQLILYICDSVSLENPIFMTFNVIDRNIYDAKYGNKLLKVEQFAMKGN